MNEQPIPITQNWIEVRQPGMAGMNTIVDQHDIKDQEAVDLKNMVFDQGVIGPRQGSKLFAAKPTGETGTPLEIMIAKTSDGINYIIAVYTSGTTTNNFYIWDSVYSQWVSINGSYLPTFSAITYFGNQSWDYGYGFDSHYFCNGYDDMCRWKMSMGYLSTTASATDTTLTLSDASRFFKYSAGISAVNSDSTTVALTASPQQNAVYTNDWELGQMVYYVGSSISGLTSGTLYYAVPTAYSLPTNGVSANALGFATSLANAIAKTTISISGSPSNATVYKAEPITIKDGSSTYSAIYYDTTSTTLKLTAAFGSIANSGAVVVPTITDRLGMPKGNILTTWSSRFVVANSPATTARTWNSGSTTFQTYPAAPTAIVSPTAIPGSANTMWLSRTSSPEDYITNNADISSGGNQIFSDGDGNITDIKDFGQFPVVSKKNKQYQFSFIVNQNLSAQFPQITPIISGNGMGPISFKSSVKAMNSIYYPTNSNGFMKLTPTTTGTNSSTGIDVISYNINNLIQSGYSFTTSRGTFFNNKLIWTAKNPAIQDTMFVYDTIRNAWTKFDSWNPIDMAVLGNNTFLFLSSIDGNLYQGFTGYTDNSNQYITSYTTKLHNLGRSALPKTMDAIYVEGYMTQGTTIYADVLFNERGLLFSQTYTMKVNNQGFIFTNENIDALGMLPINQGILDSLTPSQIQSFGFFRTYLSVPNSYGLYAVQVTFRTKDPNCVWFMTGYAFNPKYIDIVPATMRLDANATINISQNFLGNGGSVTIPSTGQTLKVETPSGVIDGANVTFTATHTPLYVVLNGSVLFENDGYTLSGLVITMLITPVAGSTIRDLYQS